MKVLFIGKMNPIIWEQSGRDRIEALFLRRMTIRLSRVHVGRPP